MGIRRIILLQLISLVLLFKASFAVNNIKVFEAKILESVILPLTENKKVCVKGNNKQRIYEKIDVLKLSKKLKLVRNCKEADLILIVRLNPENTKFEKPTFALDYYSLRNCKNCIGGFFWRRGRPQIIIFSDMLKDIKKSIPSYLKKYALPKNVVKF